MGYEDSYSPLSWALHLGAVSPWGAGETQNQTVGARERGFGSWTVLSWKGP